MILFLFFFLSTEVMAQGLVSVDYQDKSAETAETPASAQEPSLSPEQMTKLKADIEVMKKNQADAAKLMKELDDEE
jgi:hypothetical protein